jgi:hypothetical protein
MRLLGSVLAYSRGAIWGDQDKARSEPADPTCSMMIGVALLFVLMVGCGESKISPMDSELRPPDDGVIVEMWTDAGDTPVYPPGKTLRIRLYESGWAEYDDYPDDQIQKH